MHNHHQDFYIFTREFLQTINLYWPLLLAEGWIQGIWYMLFLPFAPKKRPESSEGLESPLALHRVEGQKVVKGRGREIRFHRQGFKLLVFQKWEDFV